MKWICSLTTGVCLLACAISGLAASGKPQGPAASARKGDTLYTKFSLFFEKGTHITTNYRRGALLPVNTEVTFLKAGRNAITVQLRDGSKLVIQNVRDYSGEDIDGIFARTFGVSKVDLSPFTKEENAAIMDGKVIKDMPKRAVLVALGYPPKHKTPSLESNQWRYWSSRFATFVVHFTDGKVSEIQN